MWTINGGSVPVPLTFQTAMTNRNYKGTAWGDSAADYFVEHR